MEKFISQKLLRPTDSWFFSRLNIHRRILQNFFKLFRRAIFDCKNDKTTNFEYSFHSFKRKLEKSRLLTFFHVPSVAKAFSRVLKNRSVYLTMKKLHPFEIRQAGEHLTDSRVRKNVKNGERERNDCNSRMKKLGCKRLIGDEMDEYNSLIKLITQDQKVIYISDRARGVCGIRGLVFFSHK